MGTNVKVIYLLKSGLGDVWLSSNWIVYGEDPKYFFTYSGTSRFVQNMFLNDNPLIELLWREQYKQYKWLTR